MDEQLKNMKLQYLCHQMTKNYVDKCRGLKNNEERFRLALEIVVQNSQSLFNLESKQKNTEHSVRSRKNGNESFKNREYYKAVEMYTESTRYAIDLSEELALAFANRSAALFELKKYADCISDIDRALELKYPDSLKSKIHKRKGLCLRSMGRSADAQSAFHEALLLLNKMTLSQNEMDKTKRELQECLSTPGKAVKPPNTVTQDLLPKICNSNPEIPCASEAVALKYSEKFGRHLVATRKISPGEILVIEEPYCVRLDPKKVDQYCSYCLDVFWALIPCKSCVNAAYCSEACRDKAWTKYHQVECQVLGFLPSFGQNELLETGIRVAIMAIHEAGNLESLKQRLIHLDENKDQRTKGFSYDGKLHGDQYCSIYSLADDADKQPAEETLLKAFWAAHAVCILARESNLFGKKLTPDTLINNPDVTFIGGLILKHIHIGRTNMHSFGATQTSTTSEHGGALMALCSRVNHACNPNISAVWYASCRILYAVLPIEEGEQLFDTYGPIYYEMDIGTRQERLKVQWGFKCECIPCKQNWALANNLPSYKDQQLTFQHESKGDKVMRVLRESINCFSRKGTVKSVQKMLVELSNSIEVLHKLSQKPCRELFEASAWLISVYISTNTLYDYVPASSSRMTKMQLVWLASLEHKLSLT